MPRIPSILFINSGSPIKAFTLEKAKGMGLETILVKNRLEWEGSSVDHFIQADTYNHKEVLAKVTDFHRGHHIDGVVTFWERDVLLASKVSQRLGLPGLDIQSAQRARDKYLMRRTLTRNGLPGPRFKRVENLKDFRDGLEEIGFPAVLKPLSGAGGKNVIKIDPAEERELGDTFKTLYRLSHPSHDPLFRYNPGKFLLEEYMEGDEVSVEGCICGDMIHLVAITDKSPLKGPYFIESGDVMPSLHSRELQERIKVITEEGVRALGYRDCGIHGELRLTEGEPRIIEIAARLGGDYLCDFVEMIYDVDMVQAVIQIALGEKPDIRVNASSGVVKGKYLLPKRAGVITRLDGIKEVEKISGVKAVKILLKEGDRVRIPPEGFDYIGWVVAWSKSPMEVDTIMNDAFEKIRIGIH